jgi:uncharacterized protein YdcH (DUF465 family)
MTAARGKPGLPETVAALEAKVENGARRDDEAREKFTKLFDRVESIDHNIATTREEMKETFGEIKTAIATEFGTLRSDLTGLKERYSRDAKWVAMKWSAAITLVVGFILLWADKVWP